MEKMYVEPQVEAKNNASGSYVAGCPAKDDGSNGFHWMCKACERTQ